MAAPISGNSTTREARMVVGGYTVHGVLGEGGSAIVFEATDPSGRAVALKVLRPDLALSPRELQRFVDEAARLRRVRHPCIVEVIDAGVLPDGRPYIAMPRLQGRSLLDRLQSGPLRFDVALQLFEQLTQGLHALHREGLVHRDIKPENIFVVEGDTRALLLDLGIARDIGADPTTTTRAGMIRGTPAYMAPERFFGKPATPATDIYELAVVFYVVLVGQLPWNAVDDPTERLRPIPPAQRGVVLPPLLADTLMRALAGQEKDRPHSTEAFAAALFEAVSPASAAGIGAMQTTSVRPTTQPLTAVSAPSPAGSGRVVPPTMMAPVVAPRPTPAPPPAPALPPSPAWSPPPWTAPAPPPPLASPAAPFGALRARHAQHAATEERRSFGIVFAALGFGVVVLGALAVIVVFANRRGAGASGTATSAPPSTANADTIPTPSSDLRCCRALNEAACPLPPAPCKPVMDIDRMLRETPRFALERVDDSCCKSLESIRKSRR